LLAAHRGRAAEATALFAETVRESTERGEGFGLQLTSWSEAILQLGQGHYAEALVAAEHAVAEPSQLFYTPRVLPEVIEAAVRLGDPTTARDALERLTTATDFTGTDWAAGIAARCRALVSKGQDAEAAYLTAIERLGRTGLRFDLARAHLLYGEWLRREGRRVDARHQLRAAHDAFLDMGAEAFAERTRRELLATGEKVRRPEEEAPTGLTSQEEHIARLAGEGRTNTEIGAELFLSSRTVEWHLRKVFVKLGITSRRDLRDALPASIRFAAAGPEGPLS
jgi:DNA-binding NarL/FixJ family response regulator